MISGSDKIKDIAEQIAALLKSPALAQEHRQPVEELFERYQGQQRLLDRLVRISDGFQSAEREHSHNSLARYEQQIRQLEKIVRISDQYQKMLIDLKKSLEHASNFDLVTGLPNRRYMTSRLKEAVAEAARRPERAFALMQADIDHFKTINDSFGHAVGDEVLACIAKAMTTVLREYDICARWGGEEFLLLFPGCTSAQAKAVAERLLLAAANGPYPTQVVNTVTISIGLTMHRPGEDIHVTLLRADNAMYQAKGQGRNRAVEL